MLNIFFSLGESQRSGRGGSSRLGQNPNFYQKFVLEAPLICIDIVYGGKHQLDVCCWGRNSLLFRCNWPHFVLFPDAHPQSVPAEETTQRSQPYLKLVNCQSQQPLWLTSPSYDVDKLPCSFLIIFRLNFCITNNAISLWQEQPLFDTASRAARNKLFHWSLAPMWRLAKCDPSLKEITIEFCYKV